MRLFSWWRRPAAHVQTPTPEFAAELFTDECIAIAPTTPGVYLLYREGRRIYIGLALAGIRAELERHRRGEYGPCTREATAFDYQLSADPERTLRELLRAHMAHNAGRLPQCNQAQQRDRAAFLHRAET